MNHSMINSMVSMNGLQQKLDILANNMANINTPGFKKKDATFEDILNNMKQQPQGFQREGRLSPLGFNQGWGAKLSQVQINFSQGTMEATGNDTDLAIEGDGLFELEVMHEDAQGNAVPAKLYTRDGSFQLTSIPEIAEDRVFLTNKQGHFVLDAAGSRISIPNGFKLSVDADGQISAYNGAKPEEGSQPIAQLQVVRALRPQFLQPVGDNMYSIPASMDGNRNDILQPIGTNSQLEHPITVRQGFLEQSNVNLADEMTELMMVQRAFQLSSRALSSSDQMMNLANNLRA